MVGQITCFVKFISLLCMHVYALDLPGSVPTGNLLELVGVSLGTLLLVLIIGGISTSIIITITYTYRRSVKRKRGELFNYQLFSYVRYHNLYYSLS